MKKGGGDRVVDWILRLCNIAFGSGVVAEKWRSTVIVPQYESKGDNTECSNYRYISSLSVVGKIYAGILVNRVHKLTEGMINDEEWGFIFQEKRRKWTLSSLLHVNDLVLWLVCGNGGTFFEMCRRKGLKVNAGKSKVVVLGVRRDWSLRFV